MKIAFLCSNAVSIRPETSKGTEIFIQILLNHLSEIAPNLDATVFAAGDSQVPFRLNSISPMASIHDQSMPHEKKIIFELALIAEAFKRDDEFDLYHVNIGDGDIVLPFAQYTEKPIIITIHHLFDAPYLQRYFDLYKDLPNVHFVSPSNAIRKLLPNINYADTIHHGIEENNFSFDPIGGPNILWAGRGIPSKGFDIALEAIRPTDENITACIVKKAEHIDWLEHTLDNLEQSDLIGRVDLNFNVQRSAIVKHYQTSKLFLFTTLAEEIFGLVAIEALACGTPVVAFANGAVPEIVIDGVTGFLVNQSDDKIRGDFTIKKTGAEGLTEAIRRIYALPQAEYEQMRRNCREHVEKYFTATRLAKDYLALYRQIAPQRGNA